MKMEQTECSETSAYKIQTPGNYPEENIQQEMYLIAVECAKFSDMRICAIVLGFLFLTDLYRPYNNAISSSGYLVLNDRTIGE
jgi:hypothetical protein